MDEISGTDQLAGMENQTSLWFKFTNRIWANVLRSHEMYTGYDVEDNSPGYERDAITKDTCLRAQDVLNSLFEERLLSECLNVFGDIDGGMTFEWYESEDFSIIVPNSKDSCQKLIAGPFEENHFKYIESINDVKSRIESIIRIFSKKGDSCNG